MPIITYVDSVQEAGVVYNPSPKEQKELNFLYGEINEMVEARDQKYRQFNDRLLIPFIDDSEKRSQGYVPSRESQDKDDWQANVFSQDTRNKLKAIIAGVSRQVPEMTYRAVSTTNGGLDLTRASVMKELVQHSRTTRQNGRILNPQLDIFWEAWTVAIQGTVVKYDGYLKSKLKRKFITSYDPITMEMEFEEKEVVVHDDAVEYLVPLREFFIKDFAIPNVQDQPAVAWIRYTNKEDAEYELGKYKNWKHVKDKGSTDQFKGDTQSFMNDWRSRVDTNEYEIIKYYNRALDKYCIIVNGILLLSVPLLWGNADKVYPFAKSIFEPFSAEMFFYGNSLPNSSMDIQDAINCLWNMMLDKGVRSLDKPLVAGIKNKDLLEDENERMGSESTIYVEDVDQIKELNREGLTSSEFALFKLAQMKMDAETTDPAQGGTAVKGVTARATVIANENAKRIRSLFNTSLEDLWLQKTNLRVLNVLKNYPLPRIEEIVGPEGAVVYQESFRTFLVEDSEFPNGERGTLAIQFVRDKESLPAQSDIDVEEERTRMQGQNFQKVAVTASYLDNYQYDVRIVPESLNALSDSEEQAKFDQKISKMLILFPEIVAENSDIIFTDFMRVYKDDPSRYRMSSPQLLQESEQGGTPGAEAPPAEVGTPEKVSVPPAV